MTPAPNRQRNRGPQGASLDHARHHTKNDHAAEPGRRHQPPDPQPWRTLLLHKASRGIPTDARSTHGRRRVDMKAREVMTDTVHAFTPDTPAGVAAEYLTSHGYTAAPVTR